MSLTKADLTAIGNLIDQKLEEKLEQKLESKFEEKLAPIYSRLDTLQADVSTLKVGYKSLSNKLDNFSTYMFNSHNALSKRVERIEDKIDYLPTKNEFYTKMDQVMGELRSSREEQVLINKRLDKLESGKKS